MREQELERLSLEELISLGYVEYERTSSPVVLQLTESLESLLTILRHPQKFYEDYKAFAALPSRERDRIGVHARACNMREVEAARRWEDSQTYE